MSYRSVSAIIVQNRDYILLVKKDREKYAWQCPQGGVEAGESGLEAALRELVEECGAKLKVKPLSKEPIGNYRYEFPDDFEYKRRPYEGAEVSFYLTKLLGGIVRINPDELIDFQWVHMDDLDDYCEVNYADVLRSLVR